MTEKEENFKKTGEWVRRERENRGWSRDYIAAAIGRSVKTIQHVELGYQELGEASQMKLEELFGATSVAEKEGEYRTKAEDVVSTVVEECYKILTNREKREALQKLADPETPEVETLKWFVRRKIRK